MMDFKHINVLDYAMSKCVLLAMHSLATVIRPRLSETELKWFVFAAV